MSQLHNPVTVSIKTKPAMLTLPTLHTFQPPCLAVTQPAAGHTARQGPQQPATQQLDPLAVPRPLAAHVPNAVHK